MFNEDSLRDAIASVWGEHGAHMDVYRELLKRARQGRRHVGYVDERGRLHGLCAGDTDAHRRCRAVYTDEETTHAPPAIGESVTPCCGRTPFELPMSDRITLTLADVTCPGPSVALARAGMAINENGDI